MTLCDWALGEVLDRWTAAAITRTELEWIKALRLRYIDLDASQPAWEQYRLRA